MRLPQHQCRPDRLFLDPEQWPRVHTPYCVFLQAHLEKSELERRLLERLDKWELECPEVGPRADVPMQKWRGWDTLRPEGVDWLLLA